MKVIPFAARIVPGLLVSASLGLAPMPAMAQGEPTPDRKDQPAEAAERKQPEPDSSDAAPEAHEPAARPVDPAQAAAVAARKHIALVMKLQAATKARIDLTGEQQDTIDRLFGDYVRSLREAEQGNRPFGVNPDDTEELRRLREQLQAARQAGDYEAVQALREQFRERIATRQDSVALSFGQFVGKVRAALTTSQRPVFRSLLRSLRLGADDDTPSDGGMRSLWRMVSDSEVGLSPEQHATIGRIIRDGVASVTEARRDGLDVKDVAARVRDDVLRELTPEQRAKVERRLNADAEDEAPASLDRIGEPRRPYSTDAEGRAGDAGSVDDKSKGDE